MEGKGLDLTALKAEARRLREAGDVKGVFSTWHGLTRKAAAVEPHPPDCACMTCELDLQEAQRQKRAYIFPER